MYTFVSLYRFPVSADPEQFHKEVFCWYFPPEKATIVEAEGI